MPDKQKMKSKKNRQTEPDSLFVATVNKMLRTPPKGHKDMKCHKTAAPEKEQATDGPTKTSRKG